MQVVNSMRSLLSSLLWLHRVTSLNSRAVITANKLSTSQNIIQEPQNTWKKICRKPRFHEIIASQRTRAGTTLQCAMDAQDWSPSEEFTVERLLAVEGCHPSQTNDVVHCGPHPWGEYHHDQGHVVYFGGDVQDFPENMLAHRDNKRYVDWNVEKTAKLLADRFPYHHIWVIKPSKMHLKTFSVYSNFVQSDAIGCPEHAQGHGSWSQLQCLLQNSLKRSFLSHSPGGSTHQNSSEDSTEQQSHSPEDSTEQQDHSPEGNTEQQDHSPEGSTEQQDHSPEGVPALEHSHPVILVGFSKGCVVLNQLLYDLPSAKIAKPTWDFLQRVKSMYWLDGGHNGGSNTWITSEHILEGLVGTDIEVLSHVTPYQTKDPMRKWIGKEQKKFVHKLKKLGVNVSNTVHFSNEDRSLENHFGILKVF